MRTCMVGPAVALAIAAVVTAAIGEEKTRLMTATIVALDVKAMTLTVKNEVQGGETEEIKLALEPGATIRMHGLKGKLDQLKAGDVVTVRYLIKEGKHLATEIQHM